MGKMIFIALCVLVCMTCHSEEASVVKSETCEDNVGHGLTCQQLKASGFCADINAVLVCRRSCHFCTPSSAITQAPDQDPGIPQVPEAGNCTDHVQGTVGCAEIPGVCHDHYSRLLCPWFCGACHDTSASATASVAAAAGGGGVATASASSSASTTASDSHCHRQDHQQCHSLHNVCQSSSMSHILCPHYCGHCDTTTAKPVTTPSRSTTTRAPIETCVDNVGLGLYCEEIPGICTHLYAQVLCRKACNFCQVTPNAVTPHVPSPSSVPAGSCVDHVINGLECAVLPGVCADPLGQIFCPVSCGQCETTTVRQTKETTTATPATATATTTATTQPAARTTTTPEATTAAAVETCVDNVGLGLYCEEIPGVCTHLYAQVLCRKACNFCQPTPNAVTPHVPSPSSVPAGSCVDHVINGLECAVLPGVCADPLGQIFCPVSCGQCETTTSGSTHGRTSPPTTMTMVMTPEPVMETCVDHLGLGLECGQVPGFCSDSYAQVLCPKTCKFCETNPNAGSPSPFPTTSGPAGSCRDHVTNGLTCASLPGVCFDTYGKVFCRRHCGYCASTSAQATDPSPPYPTPAPQTTATTGISTSPPESTLPPPTATTAVPVTGNATTSPSNSTPPTATPTMSTASASTPLPSTTTTATAEATVISAMSSPASTPSSASFSVLPSTTAPATGSASSLPLTSTVLPSSTTAPDTAPTGLPQSMLVEMSSTLPTLTMTTVEVCEDQVGLGFTCSLDYCEEPLASVICRKTCGFCEYKLTRRTIACAFPPPLSVSPEVPFPATTLDLTAGCADKIVGLTCQQLKDEHGLDPCQDHLGHQVCAKFCNFCWSSS